MMRKNCASSVLPCLALTLLLAAPGLAQSTGHTVQESIKPGFDFWQTVGSGATHYDFAEDPLPAGFFCKGSKPFSGKIALEGVPLTTEPARKLGTSDTVIERLDTAKYDASGLASTKIQVRALNLEGRDKIVNECGEFTVSASLVGQQPVTDMFLQQSTLCADVGLFTATLELNAELTFTNTATGKVSGTVRHLVLPTFTDAPFTAGATAARCPVANFVANQQVTIYNGTDLAFDVISNEETFAAGCWCNCDGTQCEPILPQHVGPHESHFTMPPCEFFGWVCPDDDPDYTDHIFTHVDDLHKAGVIDESPAVATDKLINKNY